MDYSKPNVGIVYNSFEAVKSSDLYETVSESSVESEAKDVFEGITSIGYNAAVIPLKKSLTGFLTRIKNLKINILINLCEGFRGIPQLESSVAGFLEILQIPFTGNKSSALSVCSDKFKTKVIVEAHGINTADYKLIYDSNIAANITFPAIVKPNNQDASLGIYSDSIVFNADDLKKQALKIIDKYNCPALAESYIDGREFNVAIMENKHITALPVSEIDFSNMPKNSHKICGYESKWFEKHPCYLGSKPVCPADISEKLAENLQQTAVKAFKALGCKDYARVDFRMDKKERIYLLEVNPNPDISLNAGFAKALNAANIKYGEFWDILIKKELNPGANI